MRLQKRGPSGATADTDGLRLAGPTAVATRRYRAGGRGPDPAPLVAVLLHEQARMLYRALRQLPERTALIVAMRFGIGEDEDEHTLQEIADVVGLSKERIRQIEHEGIEALRVSLRSVA
jgi:RNA polymerase sigma factor (sigma-70 family)